MGAEGETPPERGGPVSDDAGLTARIALAEEWPARVAAVLGGGSPARIALVGERAAALVAGLLSRDATDTVRFASIEDCLRAAPARRQSDAALFVPDTLAGLERALGTACRLYPSRLLLFVDGENVPAPERLFAFGFRRLAAGAGGELHEYRLRDYKQPPDWLNARFWANPERFGEDPADALDDTDADALDETDVDGTDDGTDRFDGGGVRDVRTGDSDDEDER